jgi:hypothetical protein
MVPYSKLHTIYFIMPVTCPLVQNTRMLFWIQAFAGMILYAVTYKIKKIKHPRSKLRSIRPEKE